MNVTPEMIDAGMAALLNRQGLMKDEGIAFIYTQMRVLEPYDGPDPPGHLNDLRAVYEDQRPANDQQRHYAKLKKEDLAEFLRVYRAAEKDYKEEKESKRLCAWCARPVDQEKPEEMSEQTQKVIETADQWLAENVKRFEDKR